MNLNRRRLISVVRGDVHRFIVDERPHRVLVADRLMLAAASAAPAIVFIALYAIIGGR